MKAIGIQIKTNVAILVVLESKEGEVRLLDQSIKIELSDHTNSEQVAQFKDQIESTLSIIKPDYVGILARLSSGRMAGSPISFKLEGIIQLVDQRVQFVWTKTINKWLKDDFEKLEPDHKYQKDALLVAHYLISNG